MTQPRLLDLFCGAGGAGEGYHRAGFEVVGVDIEPQPNYPFTFYRGDALTTLQDAIEEGMTYGCVAIHASPPCRFATDYARTGNVGVHPNLIPGTRRLLEAIGLPYVIENIVGARDHLRDPVQICGTGLGLKVQRHRLFEASFALMGVPCAHGQNAPRFTAATNRAENSRRTVEIGVWRIPLDVQQRAMGIDWMTLEELSEAIAPAYTEHIGRYLMAEIQARAENRDRAGEALPW